ncbi:SDR family NAD(P)-dependent oxidoreductase [Sinomonas sp. G460-2]|uniref:SDR family NAD(P)-dependent oxidoreductase n=1 Tax=Sinomonas sp. G460-2 TaxID=3393464 RepID=UPI0039EEFBEF
MTLTPGMLNGKTILITGASGGIGAATARVAHREGAVVVVHYGSNRASAESLSAELGDGRVHLVQGDLANPAETKRVWEDSVRAVGHLDVLVNNAGAYIPTPMDDDDAWREGWERNVALNIIAPADLTRYAIRHFQERNGGIIVNVASRSSHRGDNPGYFGYGAAKGALLSLSRGVARGYAKDGVLSYAVAPAWVATSLTGKPVTAEAAAALPLGEVIPPEDVAETIAFLASGRARHTTGTTVDITGADYVR